MPTSADRGSPPRESPKASGAFRLRVRYCECDPMGVAHHASYIPWLEEARTELLRACGASYAQLEADGVFLAVVKLQASYRRPARYDDLLDIHVRVSGGSRVKLLHEYEVRLVARQGLSDGALTDLRHRADDLLVTASTTLACIDAQGRPQALPDWLAPERRRP